MSRNKMFIKHTYIHVHQHGIIQRLFSSAKILINSHFQVHPSRRSTFVSHSRIIHVIHKIYNPWEIVDCSRFVCITFINTWHDASLLCNVMTQHIFWGIAKIHYSSFSLISISFVIFLGCWCCHCNFLIHSIFIFGRKIVQWKMWIVILTR